MSRIRQPVDHGVLVRFWALDHHRSEAILWPVSEWPKLVYTAEGTLQVESRDRLWVLPANRALWVPAGESHKAATLGKAKVRTLYFAPSKGMDRPSGTVEVSPLLREVIVESCRSGPLLSGNPLHQALALILRTELERAAAIPTEIVLPSTDWVREWASQFMNNPSEPPQCYWSRRTLERHILRETGLSMGQWSRQARAVIGLRALSTGSTVQEAAMEAGFATASGFVHSFRKRFGITPGRLLQQLPR